MKEDLIEILKNVGKPAMSYECPDGSTVLILPYGGRVLGLFAPTSGENFYWTHPALGSIDSARAFYDSDEWHNSGGDRTWLAPEADIFFPNFPSLDKYWQPRELDPGRYEIVRTRRRHAPGEPADVHPIAIAPVHRVGDHQVDLPGPNPLRYERSAADLRTLEYAGYTQHTSLAVMEGTRRRPRPGGTMESRSNASRRRSPRTDLWPDAAQGLFRHHFRERSGCR